MNTHDFQDNLAFALEGLADRLSGLLEQIASPFDFSWKDVAVMASIGAAEGEFQLTRLLYPSSGDRERAQELFQRLKDAGFVEVKHSEDGPVMIELTPAGKEFEKRASTRYHKLHQAVFQVVSESFAADLKAVAEVLESEGVDS